MKRKAALSFIMVMVIAASMSVGAFAAEQLTEIKAYLNAGLKFSINGEAWQPKDQEGNVIQPITYNSTTYLPVRSAADALGLSVGWDGATQTVILGDTYDEVLYFPADRFPETAAHIASAILAGESAVCTIDRAGADENREKSLAGIPTRDGYDRDEWPMAMCGEGGEGASVSYLDPSDNRGAGSWVGNELEDLPDGTKVKFVVTYGDRIGATDLEIPSVQEKDDTTPAAATDSSVSSQSTVLIKSINQEKEEVVLLNNSDVDVDLSGWQLVSVTGNQTFTFPEGATIKARQTVKIYSGDYEMIWFASGDYSEDVFTWGYPEYDGTWNSDKIPDKRYIWNNSSSDPAELYDSSGNLVAELAD